MGFFKDVRDDIKAVLDRDPAARNGFLRKEKIW